eukprot:3278465-Karenia_brevis.AAC.1
MEGGIEIGFRSSTGSILDSYRLQSGHDNQQHTSMRRPRSHAAHRAKSNPLTNPLSRMTCYKSYPPWNLKALSHHGPSKGI